jgi:FkbM family methyltransferase
VLISARELSRNWNVEPSGVLHVGAHLGEEAGMYSEAGWLPVIWIESQPELAARLAELLDPKFHKVINSTVWERNNEVLKLKIASNSQSSSLLDFGTHKKDYPDITWIGEIEVTTSRLDSIEELRNSFNFINLDIQGVELSALKGLGLLWDQVNYVYSEVNRKEVYRNCVLIQSLDEFLDSNGFKRVCTRWHYSKGWGDALWIRKTAQRRKFRQKVSNLYSAIRFYTKKSF